MAGEYKSACGCKIHVAQWTSKRKLVSQESCPVHKNATAMVDMLGKVVNGFTYDPGHSDLDDEQPISISMTLGEYRQARRILSIIEEKV